MNYLQVVVSGDIERAKRIFQETKHLPEEDAVYYAAMLNWLLRHGVISEDTIYHRLIDFDPFESVDWLLQHGLSHNWKTSSKLADLIAGKGKLDLLKRLDILPGISGVNRAAENGHFEMVVYLASKEVLPDEHGCNMAVHNNHLKVLNFLETKGVLPNKHAFCLAMLEQDPKIIDWLFERGHDHDLQAENLLEYFGNSLYQSMIEKGYTVTED